MDKRGIYKAGVFGILFLIIFLLGLVVLNSYFLSASENNLEYFVGDNFKIDLGQTKEYKIKIASPSTSVMQQGNSSIIVFKLKEEGDYVISLNYDNKTEIYNIFVSNNQKNNTTIIDNFESSISNASNISNITYYENNSTGKNIEEIGEKEIIAGKDVIWVEKINVSGKVKIKIPKNSFNVSIYQIENNEKRKINRQLLINPVDVIESFFDKYNKTYTYDARGILEIEYYTSGAKIVERNISYKNKIVSISSPEGIHYNNVITKINIEEVTNDASLIKIYWEKENKYLDFSYFDNDNDSLLDSISWTTPHLSEQIFNISIGNSIKKDFNFNEVNVIYEINDILKINLENMGNYELKIIMPDGNKISRISTNDQLFIKLNLEGIYKIELTRGGLKKEYIIKVINSQLGKIKHEEISFDSQVKWSGIFNENIISVPFSATGIKIYNTKNGKIIDYLVQTNNISKFLIINSSEEYYLEYFTLPPIIIENQLNEKKKELFISSDEDVNYQNISVSTNVNEFTYSKKFIKVYWKEENKFIEYDSFDLDNNGYIDRITFIIPHLSNQTFEIIYLSNADYLDENKNFIEDIYYFLKERDNIFYNVEENHFVRVTFERLLSSNNDISMYARSNFSNATVEIYEINSENKLAQIRIGSEKLYKIYLGLLNSSQDSFDIKASGGDVEFDYIVDPSGVSQYTYSGVTQANNLHWAYFVDLDAWPPYDGVGTISGNTNVFTELADGDYTNIATSNNNRYNSPGPGNGDEVMLWMQMKINEEPFRITQIKFLVEANAGSATSIRIHLFNVTSNSWDTNSIATYAIGTGDGVFIGNISSGFSDYINSSGIIRWGTYQVLDDTDFDTDYVEMNVTYIYNPPSDPTPEINSTLGTNLSNDDLNCFDSIIDADADRMNVTVRWFKNDILNLTFDYNNSYLNNTFFNVSLSSFNISGNQNWSCSLRIFDGLNFSSWVNSTKILILEEPNFPPLTPTPEINSTLGNNFSSENLNCFDIINDSNYNRLNVTVRWFLEDSLYSTIDYNNSYSSGSFFNATLLSSNLIMGQNWSCSLRVFDGINYTSWVNSTKITLLRARFNVNSMYTYAGVTQANNAHWAYNVDLDAWPPYDGVGTETGNTNTFTELTNGEYTSISTSNNDREQVPDPGNGDEGMLWLEININQTPNKIERISYLFEGYPATEGYLSIFLYNSTSDAWMTSAISNVSYSTSDAVMIANISNGFSDFINSASILKWGVYSSSSSEVLNVDYVELNVSWSYAIPDDPSPEINSTTIENYSNNNLNCFDFISDADADRMNVTVRWFKEDSLNLTIEYNNSYANNSFFNSTFLNTSILAGQNWSCSLRIFDGQNYSSWVNSSKINIRQEPNVAPATPTPEINSTLGTNYSSENLNCFDIISDENLNKLNVTVRWYKNNVLNISYDYNNSYSSGSFFNSSLSSTLTNDDENWSCSIRLFDGQEYSQWGNSSNIFIISTLYTAKTSYTYAGVTQANNLHWAYFVDLDAWPPYDGIGTISGNTNVFTELADGDYVNIATTDNNRYNSPGPGTGDEVMLWMQMKINEAPSRITQIKFLIEANAGSATSVRIHLFNVTSNSWDTNSIATYAIGTGDGVFIGNISSGFSDYINSSGIIRWGTYQVLDDTDFDTDYVEMNVTFTNNAPENPTPEINSTRGTNYSNQNLNCFDQLIDVEADRMNVSVRWFKENNLNLSFDYNNSYLNNTFFNVSLASSNLSAGDNWSCSLRIFDGINFSNWVNSTRINIKTTPPSPSAVNIQCEESGSFQSCSNIGFGETLTRVRVNCTQDVINATFNLTGIADRRNYFYANATSFSGGYYIYDNQDIYINDSGPFNLNVSCIDSDNVYYHNSTNWTIAWGSLSINLINPTTHKNVNPNNYFDFTAQINCLSGECSNVNATLDPNGDWFDTDWKYRRIFNVSGTGTLLTDFQINVSINLSSAYSSGKINSDCSDLRFSNISGSEISYWIESCNVTGRNSSIWVEVPRINQSGNTSIYMYYGNPSATSLSNENTTFVYFDTGNQNANFTIVGTAGQTSAQGNPIPSYYATSVNGNYMFRNISLTNNMIVDFNVRSDGLGNFFFLTNSAGNGQHFRMETRGGNSAGIAAASSWTSWSAPSACTNLATNRWYNFRLVIGSTSANAYINGTACGGAYSFTNNGQYIGLVGDALGASYNTWWDNIVVRKYSSTTPSQIMGSEESNIKGIIPMNSGTPFYTIHSNPMSYQNTSCLANMVSGQSCNVTWRVNATGVVGTVWDFFVFANTTNYSSYFNSSAESIHINITIGNLPPLTPELNFPINGSAFSSFSNFNWSNTTDPTGDLIYYVFQISNQTDFSSFSYVNNTIKEKAEPTGDTPTGIVNEGTYYWRVLATDLYGNSSWSEVRTFYYDNSNPVVNLTNPANNTLNTTSNYIDFFFNVTDISNVTSCILIINNGINSTLSSISKGNINQFTSVLQNGNYNWSVNCTDQVGKNGSSEKRNLSLNVANNPPIVGQIECEQNGAYTNCSNILFGHNLTGIRVYCSDIEGGVVNATINMTNIPDSFLYVNNYTNISSSNYWILNTSTKYINDSGNFSIYASCTDSNGLTRTNSTSWLVPWGSTIIDLIDPSTNVNKMKGQYFNFSTKINCVGGECGNVNATLDPTNWYNTNWSYRKAINISGIGTSLSDFQIKFSTNLTSLYSSGKINLSCSDLRFANSSGSEINYWIENCNLTGLNSYIYVKVPTISSSGNTTIYMYYGNPSATTRSNGTATFEFFDDFSSDLSKWTIEKNSGVYPRIESGYLVNGGGSTSGTYGHTSIGSNRTYLNFSNGTIEGKLYLATDAISEVAFRGVNQTNIGYKSRYDARSGQGLAFLSPPYSGWNLLGGCTSTGTAPSTTTWLDFNISVNGTTFTTAIQTQVKTCTSSSYNSPGEIAMQNHYGSYTYYDDIRVLKYATSTPISTLGGEEIVDKGTIPMNSGTPFYTIHSNPMSYLNTSCLANMVSGQSCNVTWTVNATGAIGSTWVFFVSTLNTNYTNYFSFLNYSNRINITIVNQIAPTVPGLFLPSNATVMNTLRNLNWTNSTDANGDLIYYVLQVSNQTDFSTFSYVNNTIKEKASPTGDTPTGIVNEGTYYWRVLATDLIDNSSWSEIRTFYYDKSAPNLTFINQSGEDGLIINETHPLDQGENISIYVSVIDTFLSSLKVIIWAGVKGSSVIKEVNFSSIGQNIWKAIVPTNSTWFNTRYNYTIIANDSLGNYSEYEGNFSLLYGSATINIDPNLIEETTNVTIEGYFNLTNFSFLANYPFNIYLNGNLLLLSNVTPIGSYTHNFNFNDTINSDFDKGIYKDTYSDGQNILLVSGNASGNFSKILDAGARVTWGALLFNYTTQACSAFVSFQEGDENGYSNTQDSYVSSGTTGTNYGTDADIYADGSPDIQRGIIKFDNIIGKNFNQIPPNATILNANINISVYDSGNIATIYEILENWSEISVTYNNRLTSTPWSSSGIGAYPSRSSTSEDSFTASSSGEYSINILNAMKRWVNGTSNNYGIVIDLLTSNGIIIRSSEYSSGSERPKLTVQYTSDDCTSTSVYIRTSNDKNIWSSWRKVNSGDLVNDSLGASRYLEYKVELSSTNKTLSPQFRELYVNYTSTSTNSSGGYEYNISSPSSFGDYIISVNTSLRTISISEQETLTVESGLPPNVSAIYPPNNHWFKEQNVTIIYHPTDANDDLANSTLIINGEINSTNQSNMIENVYNYFYLNFTSGQYNWSVNVTDLSNLKANTSTRTFYVDLIDPNISLIYPGNESVLVASEINLSFNATDNMDPNLSCNIYMNNNLLYSNIPSSNGVIINRSSGTLTSGRYLWNVSCFDEANRSFTSQTWEFNISDTPPTLALVFPQNGYLDGDGNISFVFNASDNSGFTNASLLINSIFNSSNQTAINNGFNTTINVSGLNEGVYNWTILIYDLSANSLMASERNFSVDLYPPIINLSTPINSSNSSTGNVEFNFSVNDTIDSSLICNLTAGNILIFPNFAASTGQIITKQSYNLTDGIKLWNVTCIDDLGHINTSETRSVNVSQYPTVTLNTSNASSFSYNIINLSYIPYDNTNLSICSLYIDDVFNQSNSTSIINNGVNNFTLSGISSGGHTWLVNCTDYAGLSNWSITRYFYIDLQGPNITLHNPNNQELGTTNITFNFSVSDDLDTSFICNLSVDGIEVDPNFAASNSTVNYRNVSGISDGEHTWHVNCTDSANNMGGSEIFNFTKSTPPLVTLIYPINNSWLNFSFMNLTYLPVDDEGFKLASLYLNGQVNITNQTEITSGYNNNFSFELNDGAYNWTVKVTDVRGLNTTASPNWTFYVDTHVPQLEINTPENNQQLSTNNITFNFTVSDNLDSLLQCNFYLDGEIAYSDNSTNGTNVINYILVNDGDHLWNVSCYDEAFNVNISQNYNFSVEAPPNVTLVSPTNNQYLNSTNIWFTYIPVDPIGIANCSLIIDGKINISDSSIEPNINNNFSVLNLEEGNHNWTVMCVDAAPDYNIFIPSSLNFSVDRTSPFINLLFPANNTLIHQTEVFNFSAIDYLDENITCNLYIDGIINISNINVPNNTINSSLIRSLNTGIHYWNVSCYDNAYNINWSSRYVFNVTKPDLMINNTYIIFNNSNPIENETISVNATIFNLENLSAINFSVGFYINDPESGGRQIGQNTTIEILNGLSNITIGANWTLSIGNSTIFVIIDPPYSSGGLIGELNETNNKANKSVNVGAWHFIYGSINSDSSYLLAENISNQSVIRWESIDYDKVLIFATDYESNVMWTSLQSLGRNISGGNSSYDYTDLDNIIGMTNLTDSINKTYTINNQAKYASSFILFNRELTQVPIYNSTNNSNFYTGIVWDTTDDNNGEYDLINKEDVVFLSRVNKNTLGTFGTYDYEIRVPAKLREYRNIDNQRVTLYTEII